MTENWLYPGTPPSKPSDGDAVRLFMEFAKRDGWVRFMDFDNVRQINGYEGEGGYVVLHDR